MRCAAGFMLPGCLPGSPQRGSARDYDLAGTPAVRHASRKRHIAVAPGS
jgi:hypothetical protein